MSFMQLQKLAILALILLVPQKKHRGIWMYVPELIIIKMVGLVKKDRRFRM